MKKYKCKFCPKSFQSEKDLEKHLKRIHGLTIATLEKLSDEGKTEFMDQCLGIMDEMDKSSMETKGE
jgi:hypothetical protein